MRHAEVHAFVQDADRDEVFDRLADFDGYAALADVVRSVRVEPGDPVRSTWEVYFRNGILEWTEVDWLRRSEGRIDFEQSEGDFEDFSGHWQLSTVPGGVEVTFAVDFDFGMPSLASIIDPVAERVLTDTLESIIGALFPGTAFPKAA